MLPDDPDAGRNTIVEIRAGTGGDEASLFASDLFGCIQGWLNKKAGVWNA